MSDREPTERDRQKRCVWTVNICLPGVAAADDKGIWFTQCGEAFEFAYQGPRDNAFDFCPFCGNLLEVEERSSEGEHDE